MIRTLAILLSCFALCAKADNTGKTFETYTILTPDADALVQITQAIGGEDSKVVFDKASSRLLVYARADVHNNIKAVLKDVNTIPQNIRIEVIVHEAGKSVASSLSAGVKGSVTISNSGTRADINASPSIKAHAGKSDELTRQLLVLQSGGEAVISVGQEVPFVNYLIALGQSWGYIQTDIEMKQIGASLRVKAAIAGNTDLITVTLTPVLSGLVENRITSIRYVKVATTVTIKNGETITLGSFGNNSTFYEKFLAGFSSQEKSSKINMTLTAVATQPSRPPEYIKP